MKALCLQLRVALCAILISMSFLGNQLNAQNLVVTCPDPSSIALDCLADLPLSGGDSLSFVSLEGASISGTIEGELSIAYSETFADSQGPIDGMPPMVCPGEDLTVSRRYQISDSAFDSAEDCVISYIISPEPSTISCDDLTVFLNEMGEASITLADISYDITTDCGLIFDVPVIDIEEFFCNNAVVSPINNSISTLDDCGNELICEFDVYVIDNTPPEITCSEDITIELDACVCESAVNFDDPIVTDMCTTPENISIARIDTTGLNSGDVFPTGVTTISFSATDLYDNVSSCSIDIIVNSEDPGALFCKGDQNISLNQDCQGSITPAMLIQDPACDLSTYSITLFDENGVELINNVIPGELLGTTVTARATYECFANSCEVDLFVEDKMPPVFDCTDMTVSCGEAIVFTIPEITDNCDNASVNLLNEVISDVSCEDPLIDKIVTRTYQIVDGNGMEISTCEQELQVVKFDISEVEAPESNVSFYCGATFAMDENGYPDPSETGAPSLDGVDLWPPQDLLCNVALDYTDTPLPSSPCAQQIIREWTVLNWYCGQDGMENYIQYITLVDTVGPVMQCPEDVSISSASMSCETMYQIPSLDIMDACQDDITVDLVYPGGFTANANGAIVELPLGINEIIYRSRDVCGQQSECTYNVTVNDNVEPVAICESGMSFSLGGDGTAEFLATSFDNGSLDECMLATVEIARMDDACGLEGNTEFGSSITLCCEDIGSEVMVILKVTDASGNESQCMSGIQVTDEATPVVLTSLPDITVSNDLIIDTAVLDIFGIIEVNPDMPGSIVIDADSVAFSGQALNGVVADNCNNATIEESKTADLDMCGLGNIERVFTISDAFGNETSMTQNISVILATPFTEDSIMWPDDITISNECSPNMDPQILNSFPEYSEDFDFRVSYTNADDTIIYGNNGCFVVERAWFVSDWCNREDGGTFVVYEDTQTISIVNSVPPVISTPCVDSTMCSFISNCGPQVVSLSALATDDCTPVDSLDWTIAIDYDNDMVADFEGVGNLFEGELPVGINTITWSVTDDCGNIALCSFNFEIESCLNPQPFCINEEAFYINPIDTSGDETPDVDAVLITTSMVDAGSKSPCGLDITLSFSEDLTDTVRLFECEDLGIQSLMLFVTDEDGKSDFCNLLVSIQDTNAVALCGLAAINGVVFGNQEDFVEEVKVELIGTELAVMTDEAGIFAFPAMEMGGSYEVEPSKVDEAINGVTTSDLVLIQKHILGIEKFDSPYKILASDVNQSNDVSAADLIMIRKLILGRIDAWPNDKTWSFVPSDFIFLDASQPWSTSIPEKYEIHQLNSSMELDFIGVKLGDVNESVTLNASSEIANRSNESFTFRKNRYASNRIEIVSDKDTEFASLLLDFEYDPEWTQIEYIKSNLTGMDFDYFETTPGKIRILVSDFESNPIRQDEILFAIDFEDEIGQLMLNKIRVNTGGSELSYEDGSSAYVNLRVEVPEELVSISQNSPNPWTESTTFDIRLPKDERVEFSISDVSGRTILLKEMDLNGGLNSITIQKEDLPLSGGLFFYQVNTSFGKFTKKMMLLAH